MGEQALSTYTYEAYLALEAESEIKYEFHDGYITAMAGGTPAHSQISGNVIWSLNDVIRRSGKTCIVHTSDLKVSIESTRRTYYPDVSVVCDSPSYSEKDPNALTNPILIIEILSESTAAFDRGAKFTHYRQIASLKEYVLVSQEEAVVDTYFRTENGLWDIQTISGISEMVELKSLNCSIAMSDIYRLVPNIT